MKNTTNKNKTILNRIMIGIREGIAMQQVPNFLLHFNNLIWVRIFKILGIISTSVILSNKFHLLKRYNIHDLNYEIFIIASIISILYLSYRIFYHFVSIVYIIKLFTDKKHWVYK